MEECMEKDDFEKSRLILDSFYCDIFGHSNVKLGLILGLI